MTRTKRHPRTQHEVALSRSRDASARALARAPSPSGRRPRRRATFAVRCVTIAATALLAATALACGAGDPPVELLPPESPAERAAHHRAALAGVDWMIESWPDMPPGWAYGNLSRLARIVTDEPQSGRIAAALDAVAEEAEHSLVPDSPEALSELGPEKLSRVLLELLRRKETGLAWQDTATAIGAGASEDELRFWKSMPLRHRPTIMYFFDELEIPTNMRLEAVTEALSQATEDKDTAELAANTRYVYALTHVVFARSRYLQQRADPAGLEFAIPIFRASLAARAAASMDVMSIDLVGEVLASLRLLGIQDDSVTRAARGHLRSLQNEDGSWGPPGEVTPRRIHPTFNAITALLDYTESLPAPPPPPPLDPDAS